MAGHRFEVVGDITEAKEPVTAAIPEATQQEQQEGNAPKERKK
jgi:hypothetical protein